MTKFKGEKVPLNNVAAAIPMETTYGKLTSVKYRGSMRKVSRKDMSNSHVLNGSKAQHTKGGNRSLMMYLKRMNKKLDRTCFR